MDSQYKESVLPYFTTGFQIVNILLLVFASTSPTINRIPANYRIGIPLIIQFLAFVVILLMVKVGRVKANIHNMPAAPPLVCVCSMSAIGGLLSKPAPFRHDLVPYQSPRKQTQTHPHP